jgi:hypothetical protein
MLTYQSSPFVLIPSEVISYRCPKLYNTAVQRDTPLVSRWGEKRSVSYLTLPQAIMPLVWSYAHNMV